VIEVELEREAKNRARVEKRLLSESLSWTWIDVTNTLADGVLEAASLADLIVLSRKLDSHSGPDMLGISSSIVMHAGKPVVAVPENTRRMALGRALIAWDGQSSCAATVRACVPLLALADDVEIFMVRDGSEMTEPLEAAQYLSQHNVHAEVRIIEGDHRQVNELIAEECSRFGADYILMGAYGRGRLIEAFGGVTKRLLAASTVPLVLGH
jgi:nucleotide-binding universal stress UspA family protein